MVRITSLISEMLNLIWMKSITLRLCSLLINKGLVYIIEFEVFALRAIY